MAIILAAPRLESGKFTKANLKYERRNIMKKKGFTLVELLVVIAIIAMLLAILMPALGKVRQLAYRLMCGTNQSGLGKAMMVYSNENDESFPRSGVSTSVWLDTTSGSGTLGWQWDKSDVFTTGTGVAANAKATVSSSLYLLIKYADVSGAQFVCQGSDQKKFELETASAKASEQNYSSVAKDLTECWDFGTIKGGSGASALGPWNYVSYSYQVPWTSYATGVSSPAGVGLMSDKSPYYDSTTLPADLTAFLVISATADLDKSDLMKKGNARPHQSEGQNVLYGDGHVTFEKMSNVGVEQDNIYTMWKKNNTPIAETDKQIGADPRTKTPGTVNTGTTPSGCAPMATDDTLLVNDGPKIQ